MSSLISRAYYCNKYATPRVVIHVFEEMDHVRLEQETEPSGVFFLPSLVSSLVFSLTLTVILVSSLLLPGFVIHNDAALLGMSLAVALMNTLLFLTVFMEERFTPHPGIHMVINLLANALVISYCFSSNAVSATGIHTAIIASLSFLVYTFGWSLVWMSTVNQGVHYVLKFDDVQP